MKDVVNRKKPGKPPRALADIMEMVAEIQARLLAAGKIAADEDPYETEMRK